MFCRKCGKAIEQDSVFCCYCGTKVAAQSIPESPVLKVDQKLKKAGNAVRKKTWIWALFVTIVLLIVGFSISGFSFFDGLTLCKFIKTNFVFNFDANIEPKTDYLLVAFYYTLLATALLFPMAFIVGNIKTSCGPIKDKLDLYFTPIYTIALISSLIGSLGGYEIGVITRVCAIISLLCFLYYCASCKYFVVPSITAIFMLVLICSTFRRLELPLCEWSCYRGVIARAEISQYICINVLICSISSLIQRKVEKTS